jgi:hypothetical protein
MQVIKASIAPVAKAINIPLTFVKHEPMPHSFLVFFVPPTKPNFN